ncbi:MAG: hypothetical protein IH586_03160 [Anaerolineaceae bacterium]|nr:hypothetical protein [Anaerolineaceae bacterium]
MGFLVKYNEDCTEGGLIFDIPGLYAYLERVTDPRNASVEANSQACPPIILNGTIVIGDAMHTQRKISVQIVEAGGHFIWTAKGNQARIEKRTILVCQALNTYLDGPYLAQVFRLEPEIWHEHGKRKTRWSLFFAHNSYFANRPGAGGEVSFLIPQFALK